MKKHIIILLGLLFLCFSVNAQSKKIKIIVKDISNNLVVDAVILFDNVRQKKTTNSFGILKTKLKSDPKEISAFHPIIGIKKIKYKGEEEVLIIIGKDNDANKIDLNSEGMNSKNKNFNSIYDYLRGKVAGVNISSDNVITIRGYNSLSGNMTPLFILNDMEITQDIFGRIIPNEIKNATILKGPETSRYGIRGANGVIIIRTK